MAHRNYRSRNAGGADDSLFGTSTKSAPRGRLPANSVVISKGELDPDAPRVLEEGRKKLELEKVFAMMTGGGKKV